MLDMNAEADIQKIDFAKIAAQFLGAAAPDSHGWLHEVARRTKEHLWLVGVSLLFSVLVGIPLGVTAVRFHAAGQAILLSSAVIQTVPSLALLCFLIPVFGVGTKPALAALCLYSLLPVVLNTFTGIRAVNPIHLENARAFGLNRRQVLFRVVLPLASPTLLAGSRPRPSSASARQRWPHWWGRRLWRAHRFRTLAERCPTILTGAIPAALMALVAHGLFEVLGFMLIPAGLRRRPRRGPLRWSWRCAVAWRCARGVALCPWRGAVAWTEFAFISARSIPPCSTPKMSTAEGCNQ